MHRQLILAVAFAVTLAAKAGSQTPDTLYDIVIRNGRVLDGQGNPWIAADVAIKDGHFVKVGRVAGHGKTELDARGKYVSPGWIDAMDQSGSVLPRNGLAENKLREGVTTAIGGEGGTPVPASRIPEYFATLERQGISINFGTYFSETQARVAVLGRSARAPSAAELDRMRAIMDTAMRAGAMGMSTALIYPPSSYETTSELVEVAKAAAPLGGIYASHIRGDGKEVVQAAGGWDGIVLVNARNPANKKYENKTIAHIAKEMGKDPADAAFDLVSQGQERVMAIYHMMGEQDIETALRFPWTSIGSDAGAILKYGEPDETGLPHPRSFGNFPRVIARYVKERKVLTLEDAVRKMTSWPATRLRLANRGAIREGNWADVTIFDLDQLQDKATYESPMEFPTGIEWVLVNGVVTVDHGRHTGAKAGQVMRGAGWVREPSKS